MSSPWIIRDSDRTQLYVHLRRVAEAGYQGFPARKVATGYPNYPVAGRDSVENGIGCIDNRHLNNLAESISVNVGGFYQDVKASSPPMTDRSVGGVIVVGVRESRIHGEGRQEVNIFLVEK